MNGHPRVLGIRDTESVEVSAVKFDLQSWRWRIPLSFPDSDLGVSEETGGC